MYNFCNLLKLYRACETPEDFGRFALYVSIIANISCDKALLAVNGERNNKDENK